MADARGGSSKKASEGNQSISTRPERLRVMRPEVEEVLKTPHRSRRPKKQQQPPPPPPQPPPPRKEKEKVKAKAKKEREKEAEDQVEHARYNCAFQDEDEDEGSRDFAPPELVWGKVRSHPWWPGQVFDAADASEVALQHRKAGSPLVAYFWDRTFAWSDGSALLPFRANFARLSNQSTMSGFVSAVDAALQEVGRRVEAGLSCGCVGSSIATKQVVQNSGIRQGAYGAPADSAYMRDVFHGQAFLDYISAIGKNPLAGADLLDLATAKAQLRAFNRSRGPRDLPEFVMFEDIEDAAEVIPRSKRKRTHKSGEDDVPSKEMNSKRAGSSTCRKEPLPESAKEEAMDEDSSGGVADGAICKVKTSRHTKSSMKKKRDISKHSDGSETVVVGDSRTPASKTVDDILSGSKSGRTLRSMRRKEDALEGLKRLGKVDSDQTLTIKGVNGENKLSRRASSARKKVEIREDGRVVGDGSAKGSTSPRKRRPGHAENSASKQVPISEHGRKKKLSELMVETGKPNYGSGGKSKSQGKQSFHESTGKAEDLDRDSLDTVKTRKRKKLNTLGLSSQQEPLSRKRATKVGELMNKAAGSTISQTPPAVKANGAASQTKSRRAKQKEVTAADKSPHPVKVNRGKKQAFRKESLSCGEMLWHLSTAACDLKQREKIASRSVNFFTDFRKNSNVSISDVQHDISEKAVNTEATPVEQPIADHMQDDFWADILINVEEPLSSLRKKKDESKNRTSTKARQVKTLFSSSSVTLENANEPISEGKQGTENGGKPKDGSKLFAANGSQLNDGTKSAEESENSMLSGLVLHFSRPSAVPSRSDLIKIFSQYGPVKEAKAETANNSAQVIFKRRMDAESAFVGAGKMSALRPALASFRLTGFPAVALGSKLLHGASKSE